jgi:C-methyltransferase C-terminal domain/Putative zinc binding domain/Methyltransferase domain
MPPESAPDPVKAITAIRRTTCRSCGAPLDDLLSLGNLYVSTFLASGDPLPPTVPLDLMLCRGCDLVQLRHTTPPDLLFRQYWYLSAINEAMRAELADVVEKAVQIAGGWPAIVMDVGANDGTLLAEYERPDHPTPLRVAYEPAHNLYQTLRPHCQVLFPDYFPDGISGLGVKAQIITSIAMFYDVDDPHTFVDGIREVLAPDGVWVVQFQDLWQMVDATAYDNLVHEHLVYYSLRSFDELIAPHGLAVVHAERRTINGGSLRLYVQHVGAREPDPTVAALRTTEAGLTYDKLQYFAWATRQHKAAIHALLTYLHDQGQIVDLYAASTKAQTLVQYAGIDHTLIRSAVERSPAKVGRRMIGSDIPIVSEATWREDPGSHLFIGAWQFKETFMAREHAYLHDGGTMIVPLPHLELVRGE